MKNLKCLLIFLLTWIIFSCQKPYNPSQPEILTAQYEIRTHSEFERGYEVFMVIDKLPKTFSVKGIILKDKLFDKVHFTHMSDNEIFIEQYFPVQSGMIQNFEAPATDNRPDGIIFEVEGKEYFYNVNFKLK